MKYTVICCARTKPPTYDKWGYASLRDEPTLTFFEHSIDTAILRTNSQIHHEAYDIMVKPNRFIRLNCAMYMPFLKGFSGHDMPTIVSGPAVEQFKGLTYFTFLSRQKRHGQMPLVI
ncbi:hypothetical protein COCSADRAFT_256492 [Bipolaris sorokiniana ND90Pr]|uniref:Uncharacterized protein n=1 Tax=Cochliobolus sativus (strain ND90Pr / ATCC 201652) TaxID=665912 RepID=M2SR45_COCSN|nr:uncharacterized protein COCSADRAFT_256492 [Bipolaris sorokiniana ND90Pr]EMD59247.1 hypothetical protein COCSADRAFT_256492 [Bipolaris sorokiniana ND90Pr]